MNVWKLIRVILPVAQKIVRDVNEAKAADSAGGKKITKEETQEIIAEHIVELGQLIEDILESV